MLPITVVIPVYNRRDLLRQALASVANQSMTADETIVVDDGSSEPLADLVAEYGARFIRQDNAGSATARNHGLQQARNEWVAFLDSDDIWHSKKLERQWQALLDHPADLCFTDMVMFNRSGTVTESMLRATDAAPDNHIADIRAAYRLARTETRSGAVVVCRPRELRTALARYNIVFPSTMMVGRARALAIGGFVPELRISQDWDFALRLSKSEITALAVEAPLVRYRAHDDNISGDYVRSAREVGRMVERILLLHRDDYPVESQLYWRRHLSTYVMSAARVALPAGQFDIAHELIARWSRLTPSVQATLWLLLSEALDSPTGNSLYRSARFVKKAAQRLFQAPS